LLFFSPLKSKDNLNFLESSLEGIWILKPSGEAVGRGIEMVFDIEKVK
jgi:hypothetical protein